MRLIEKDLIRLGGLLGGFVMALLLSVVPMAQAADILVEETGLADHAVVKGVDATGGLDPVVSGDNITVIAGGETDPALNADIRLQAYGLYSAAPKTMTNSGTLDVEANGGNAESGASSSAAEVFVDGIYSHGPITNAGKVTVTGTGGNAASTFSFAVASVLANGIASDDTISNDGEISITATGGDLNSLDAVRSTASAEANGLYAIDGGSIENSGTITGAVTGGNADSGTYSISRATISGINSNGTVNNLGDITLTAQGGRVSAGRVSTALATGIINAKKLYNSGNITVTATGGSAPPGRTAEATARGIRSHGDVDNRGNIQATAQGGSLSSGGYATGISSWGHLSNRGEITVMATGGRASLPIGYIGSPLIHARGIGLSAGNGVNNNGDISVTVTGEHSETDLRYSPVEATGIYSGEAVVNSGDIHITATGGFAEDFADTAAYGIKSADITNTGNITVTTTGGNAALFSDTSVSAGLASLTDNKYSTFYTKINNTGPIIVTSSYQGSYRPPAQGILFTGNGDLTNTGIIRVDNEKGYEVSVMTCHVTLVDTYNVTLDGDPEQASFYISGGTLNLNNALLTVTDIEGETEWNTEYRLFKTWHGSVAGGFSAVRQPLNPSARAIYNDQGTPDSADDTVALAYRPAASTTIGAINALQNATLSSVNISNNHVAALLLQDALDAAQPVRVAAAETVVSDVGGGLFTGPSTSSAYFEPYYSWLDSDTSPLGYDGNIGGFVTGYDQRFGNNLLGFHLGYGRADIDFSGTGFDASSEDQDVFTLGVDAAGRRGDWTLRFSSTAFHGSHDYHGLSGISLNYRETADYDSYGACTSLMAGRLFRFGNQVLLPEVGLNHIWTHRESYTSRVKGARSWNTRYGSFDDHEVQAEAKLRWQGNFTMGEQRVIPSLAAGAKHFLSNTETSAHQSVSGSAPVRVETDRDETAVTLSASLALVQNNMLNLTLAYDGEYTSDTRLDTVWLRLRMPF